MPPAWLEVQFTIGFPQDLVPYYIQISPRFDEKIRWEKIVQATENDMVEQTTSANLLFSTMIVYS